MRKFELVVKEIVHPKITIAKDRCTLKLPFTINADERQEIEAFAKRINAEHPPVEYTVRGAIHNRKICFTCRNNGVEPSTWTY